MASPLLILGIIIHMESVSARFFTCFKDKILSYARMYYRHILDNVQLNKALGKSKTAILLQIFLSFRFP